MAAGAHPARMRQTPSSVVSAVRSRAACLNPPPVGGTHTDPPGSVTFALGEGGVLT